MHHYYSPYFKIFVVFAIIAGIWYFFKGLFSNDQASQKPVNLPDGRTIPPIPSALRFLLLMFIAGTLFDGFFLLLFYNFVQVKTSFWEFLINSWQISGIIYGITFIGGMLMYGLMELIRPPQDR